MDVGQFDDGARKAAQLVVARTSLAITSASQYLMSELTKDVNIDKVGSPVASGRYVASMRIALNEADTSSEPADPHYHYPPGKGPRPLPPRTIAQTQIAARVASLMRTFKLGDKVIISNSVPYSRRIEVGGHSWQAPGGVFFPAVRRAIARFKNSGVNIGASIR